MLIRNASVLLGEDLRYVQDTSIGIRGGRFCDIGQENGADGEQVDCEGLLLIPGLVNCHTHVGDSVAKDVALNETTDGRVHPASGVKVRVLEGTDDGHLVQFMRAACQSMVRRGITTFVDFREGGMAGVALLRKAVREVGIRPVIMGRIGSYQNAGQIRKNSGLVEPQKAELVRVLQCCDGLGISGANENSDAVLKHYSQTPKLRAIHAAETEQSTKASRTVTGRGEVERALEMRPHFVVHMTHASPEEIRLAAAGTRGVVVCPRANGALAGGVPDVGMMLKAGCTVAIGTDNIMVNSPDMFREMDYTWKVAMGRDRSRIDPREILKMATVNASRILCRDVGVIRQDAPADAVFVNKHALDLEPMHNPHASVVHRVSESAIRAVMIGGRIVHGQI